MFSRLKRVITIIMSVAVISGIITIPVSAADNISIVVNASELKFNDGFPEIIGSGTTMVPFRVIFEALGFSVSYNKGTNESGEDWFRIWAIKSDEDIRIDMYLGSNVLYKSVSSKYEESDEVNKLLVVAEQYSMPEAPYVDETNRTLVPVRVIAESLGANVSWDQKTKTVNIDYNRCGENLTYKYNNGVLTISGTGEMWDFSENSLPKYSEKEIRTIVLDSNITSIGSYAFYNCNVLETIEISDNIVDIKDYAFANCSSLRYMELPDGLKKIKPYLFANCTKLQSVKIPRGISFIAVNAFSGCDSLRKIEYMGTKSQWNKIDFSTRPDSSFMNKVKYQGK